MSVDSVLGRQPWPAAKLHTGDEVFVYGIPGRTGPEMGLVDHLGPDGRPFIVFRRRRLEPRYLADEEVLVALRARDRRHLQPPKEG